MFFRKSLLWSIQVISQIMPHLCTGTLFTYKRYPARALTAMLDSIHSVCPYTVHLTFWQPSSCLFLPGKLMEKEQGQTVQPVAPQGLSDLSLLCHKGTPSLRWPCKTVWTSRRSPVCWGTTTRASPSAPTPTPPGRCRTRRRKPWAASWRR